MCEHHCIVHYTSALERPGRLGQGGEEASRVKARRPLSGGGGRREGDAGQGMMRSTGHSREGAISSGLDLQPVVNNSTGQGTPVSQYGAEMLQGQIRKRE